MGDRFGTNSAIYDLSRLMTFAVGIPAENVFSAPIILDNPSITSGIALFSHTAQPFSVAVAAASELTLIDLDFANTAGAGTQFYGLKIQTDADTVDTAAGIAIFNAGRADSIYLNVAGKDTDALNNSPTGIGIDINKELSSSAERDAANSSQQGIQIYDWSTTDQGIGGPRGMLIQKVSNVATDHLLMTLRSNRNLLQFVVISDSDFDATKPAVRFDDEVTGITWWQILASGEQVFNKDGVGIQWVTPGPKSAYILASTNDLKLKSGGDAIRFVNEADTQTIVLMNDNLTVDIPNAETRFQAIKIIDDRIENYLTNALASVSINYDGYAGGVTQFRDFKVFDGKTNVVAIFTGTNKNFLLGTATDKGTGVPHAIINDGSSIFQSTVGGLRYFNFAHNAWFDGTNAKRLIANNNAGIAQMGGTGLELYFQQDAGNTVDSTITLSRYYQFSKTQIAFFGAGGASQATITGSRDGNAGLASLLTALAGYGLIVDSSTDGPIPQATLKASGVHKSTDITYISGTGTAGADNTAQTVKSLTLAANALTQVGDRLRIRSYWTGTTGNPITGTTKLGPAGSEVTVSDTTDGGGATLQLNEAWIHYLDNTHANIIENEAGALGAVSNVNVAGFTWNANQNIILTQNAILNNHVVVYALIVDIFPKGVA